MYSVASNQHHNPQPDAATTRTMIRTRNTLRRRIAAVRSAGSPLMPSAWPLGHELVGRTWFNSISAEKQAESACSCAEMIKTGGGLFGQSVSERISSRRVEALR